jgi:hypothetical protein
MKKIILLLFILIQFSFSSQSQDSLTFKVQYKPETKYSQTFKQTSETYIKYSGSEDFLQQLAGKGVQNPAIINNQSTTESVFNTGKLTDGVNFPLTMEIVKTTSSDGKKVIPDGTLIYGHSSTGNMPTLDSIVSNGLNEGFKKTLLQTMQNFLGQISFREQKIKVGESFSRESPLSIPIAGDTIDMAVTTTYKLLSIINGVGNFDVSQEYTLRSIITKYTLKATGNGKGSLVYDVSNNYYLSYQLDTDLTVKTNSGFVQTTKISKN